MWAIDMGKDRIVTEDTARVSTEAREHGMLTQCCLSVGY